MLRSAPDTLTALTTGLTDDTLGRRSGEGEWSVPEIVAHLVDGEWAWFTRIRRMATEEQPRMDRFPDADYSRPSLHESVTRFARDRGQDVDYLESLPAADWARSGRHQIWGEIDILWAARHLAAHDAEHFAQIARICS